MIKSCEQFGYMTQCNQCIAIKQQVNKFTFADAGNTIQIVFYPHAPGSLSEGEAGPRLDYQGDEGSFHFQGDQMQRQDDSCGSVITFVLKKSIEAKALTLKLLLPAGNLADQNQVFETVLLKTRSFGIVPEEGARLLYEVFLLQGLAAGSPTHIM